MRAISLFSGGKDSTYALYIAMQQGFEIEKLVTIFPKVKDSYMYHIPVIERTKVQSELIGIKQDVYRIGDDMEELKRVIENYDVDAVISGAIASNYQKTRIEEVCTDLNVLSYSPLWGKGQRMILEDMLSAGFEIIIVGVSAYGLDSSDLGRKIEEKIEKLKELEKKYKINLSGEGGEYETFVVDAPFFKKKIKIKKFKKIWDGLRGEIKIEEIELEEKREGESLYSSPL